MPILNGAYVFGITNRFFDGKLVGKDQSSRQPGSTLGFYFPRAMNLKALGAEEKSSNISPLGSFLSLMAGEARAYHEAGKHVKITSIAMFMFGKDGTRNLRNAQGAPDSPQPEINSRVSHVPKVQHRIDRRPLEADFTLFSPLSLH